MGDSHAYGRGDDDYLPGRGEGVQRLAFLTTCIRTTWQQSRWRAAAYAATGLVIALAFRVGLVAYYEAVEPVEMRVGAIQVVSVSPDVPARDLLVDVTFPPLQACWRQSQWVLYRDWPERRVFYPLAYTIGGAMFPLNASGPTSVALSLPAALPAGEYWFIQRTLYDCSWLFGLASRKIGYQTDAARVVIR